MKILNYICLCLLLAFTVACGDEKESVEAVPLTVHKDLTRVSTPCSISDNLSDEDRAQCYIVNSLNELKALTRYGVVECKDYTTVDFNHYSLIVVTLLIDDFETWSMLNYQYYYNPLSETNCIDVTYKRSGTQAPSPTGEGALAQFAFVADYIPYGTPIKVRQKAFYTPN